MRVCCTGGAGYIGSHTVVKLLEQGHEVLVLDDLSNSSPKALDRVAELAGGRCTEFEKIDLAKEPGRLNAIFAGRKVDAVIHFAGLKAVGESVQQPLHYYENNLISTFNLLRAMEASNCGVIVFSSSATVYKPCEEPINEDCALGASNPYGQTKFFIEQILRDACVARPDFWSVAILRYFNPVGAHPSGRIGESPKGMPNNLMPIIQQVAVGRRAKFCVFGSDYNTPDGTGVRDYIHVEDLADGHIAALSQRASAGAGCVTFNLGAGTGTSVLEMQKGFARVSGREIPYDMADRRPGDLAIVIANAAKAKKELNWETTRTMEQAFESAWKWQSENPTGYESE